MMLEFNDAVIDSGIDNISGYIVARAAECTGMPLNVNAEKFFRSRAYSLLLNKNTGYYWDSMSDLLDIFLAELSDGLQESP
jgi:hypothetical protein